MSQEVHSGVREVEGWLRIMAGRYKMTAKIVKYGGGDVHGGGWENTFHIHCPLTWKKGHFMTVSSVMT